MFVHRPTTSTATEYPHSKLMIEVQEFLRCPTPDAWLQAAPLNLDTLLIDHANCEKKAAGTALSLLYKYVDHGDLLLRLSKLAREELRHFEQVLGVMRKRGIAYSHLSAARYAGQLRGWVRKNEPDRLVDILLVGALVEARSCERFLRLQEVLDTELAEFYRGLCESEARHFGVYLKLAENVAQRSLDERLDSLLDLDVELITATDPDFRFHSGVPS